MMVLIWQEIAKMTDRIPKPVFILQNSGPITSVLFSEFKEEILFTSNRNGLLNIYDLNLRRSIFECNPNRESILSVAELSENSILTHSRNGTIHKWTQTQTEWISQSIYEKEIYTFCQFALGKETGVLYLPSNETSIIDCIELTTNTKINSFLPGTNAKDRGLLMNLKVIDSNLLLSGYENGELVLFDLKTFKEVTCANLFHGQPTMCFDFCKSLNVGFGGSSEKSLIEIGLNFENMLLHEKSTVELVNPGLNCIKIRKSDSKIVSCGGWDNRIRLYGTKKLKLLACLDFHKEAVNSIDFSMKNLMAVGGNDNLISFWDLY